MPVIVAGSYVVDASVAFKWYLMEADEDRAGRLLLAAQRQELSLFAPDLLALEVANIAWKRYRRGDLSVEEACGVVDEILAAPVANIGSASVLRRATEIATTLSCTVYDSLYLALARTYDALLITGDRRLCEKAPERVRLLRDLTL